MNINWNSLNNIENLQKKLKLNNWKICRILLREQEQKLIYVYSGRNFQKFKIIMKSKDMKIKK